MSFLIFASPYGSGKTLFMTAKAIELAQKGEKVLFLIFYRWRPEEADDKDESKDKTLLCFDLEQKFKKYSNIKVQMIPFRDGANKNFKSLDHQGIKHVMIDEFFGDYSSFDEETKNEFHSFISDKQTVWMALSNSYNVQTRLDNNVDIEEMLKNEFPSFSIANMDKPLRLPLNVAKEMKSQASNAGKVSRLTYHSRLMRDCKLASNVAEGSIIDIGHGKMELLAHLLQKAFEAVNHKRALIIINENASKAYSTMKERVHCRKCWNKIVILMIDLALQLIGRKPGKVLTRHFRSKIQQTLEWTAGIEEGDMIASLDHVRGCEYNVIIDTTGFLQSCTRSMATVVRIHFNPMFDMEYVIKNLLGPSHQCSQIMDRSLRPEIPTTSISSLIGK